MSISFTFRTYFSIQHIQSAALFARLSKDIELEHVDKLSDLTPEIISQLRTKHLAFVTNAIFSSVSFLEATINEVFCDASNFSNHDRFINIDNETIYLMKDKWQRSVRRAPTLEKYQEALALLDKPLFHVGKVPYQDINSLIKLRNTLIHFEPETVSSSSFEPENRHKFEKMLMGKFKPNLMMNKSGNPYFPNKCLSYGCADWAVIKSIQFADEFNNRMGLKPMYEHVRPYLIT